MNVLPTNVAELIEYLRTVDPATEVDVESNDIEGLRVDVYLSEADMCAYLSSGGGDETTTEACEEHVDCVITYEYTGMRSEPDEITHSNG